MEFLGYVLCFLLGGIILGVVGFFLGGSYRKKIAEKEIGSAEEEAKRIVADAEKNAQSKKKEALIEAKDEIFKLRQESEREIKERRSEVGRQERRIQQKEETLDRKIENLERKDEQLQNKIKSAEQRLAETEQLKKSQFDMLEKISGFTVEQAKEYLLSNLENELVHEKAVKISAYEQQLKDEAEQKARELISYAISRCAAGSPTSSSVSRGANRVPTISAPTSGAKPGQAPPTPSSLSTASSSRSTVPMV